MKNILFILPFLFLILFIVSFIKDRSKYRNSYYLFFTIIFTLELLIVKDMININILFSITLIMLLFLPFFLVINGIIMIKREGHGIAHLLSLALGLIIGFGEISTFIAVLTPEIVGSKLNDLSNLFTINRISMFFSISIMYISITFVVFVLYCLFLQILPKKRNFNYIIVLGSGLIDGEKVPKLLSDRIDKAIQIYKKSLVPSKIVLSGGQGSDEKISEAEAMKRYCIEKGIPDEDLIKEDKSTTTYENLNNSKAIINSRSGVKNIILVTSNYHVYRALRYSRKIKMNCNGVGSHVAFYYWPSALIREYIAIHAEKKHLIILILGWLLCIILVFLMNHF